MPLNRAALPIGKAALLFNNSGNTCDGGANMHGGGASGAHASNMGRCLCQLVPVQQPARSRYQNFRK